MTGELHIERIFLFSLIWSFGVLLDDHDRRKFSDLLLTLTTRYDFQLRSFLCQQRDDFSSFSLSNFHIKYSIHSKFVSISQHLTSGSCVEENCSMLSHLNILIMSMIYICFTVAASLITISLPQFSITTWTNQESGNRGNQGRTFIENSC